MTENLSANSESSPAFTDQWLVRTAQNLIHGPYTKQEICSFIQNSKLTTLDEVCSAAGYWFFLHEVSEVQKQLGVNPPVPAHGNEDEITETEVVRAANLSSLAEENSKETRFESGAARSTDARSPERTSPADRDRAAAEAVQRALQRSHQREDAESGSRARGTFELLSFWKIVTVFLVIVSAALFLSIVRLIRQ